MKNKSTKILAFICIFFTSLLFSLRRPVHLESPFKVSWYKKAFDMCMYVWGDVRALAAVQDTMQPEQLKLYFDTLIGRLTQADRYVAHLIQGKVVVGEDDITYLVHVLGSLSYTCSKLIPKAGDTNNDYVADFTEQIQCMLSVVKNIKSRLEAVLGPEFILSKIEQIEK